MSLILLTFVFPSGLCLAALEIEMRVRQCSKRKLELMEKGIRIGPARQPVIRWHQIIAWRFEPAPDLPEGEKVSIRYSFDRRRRYPRTWAIVLQKSSESRSLMQELKERRTLGKVVGEIEVCHAPVPAPRARHHSPLGLWACMLGVFLLLHGLPLLFAGLFAASGPADRGTETGKLSERQNEKLSRFVAEHFSSATEFRRFIIMTGSLLAGAGALSLGWAVVLLLRNDRRQDAQE